ncbi:MAG TPA: DUF2752 domain-containing protein [Bacteroidales bacterium]|jgi:hypothetical protein|nr:DUF2752 domain-containing protein [Bacteroidota bacterium]OQC62079.1 MAG: hypothetical protein BWX51_00226 [Bacteroidetes bacterium ADurb.Bin012]HNQ60593.1 DUF2752 domain-containing protein [Bacteroidales bacterium]HNU22429.1 DUF2752 domain-containing protein [Bacteroidales bacterium]HNV17956.1 DUF2752 domain-containing protein [Bacteroidales bacterium]
MNKLKAFGQKGFIHYILSHLEGFIWIFALGGMMISPVTSEQHFTFCPFYHLGFRHCPGCGIGRSMILALHGRIEESLMMHPLGLIAIIILIIRTIEIFSSKLYYSL